MKLNLKNTRISTRLFFGFAIVMIVVVAVVIVALYDSNEIIKGENLIVHSHEVLNELKDIEVSLIDLETGQRGYIITGDLKYLEPYNTNLFTLNSKVDFLQKMTADNPSQTKRINVLKEMILIKLSVLNTAIDVRNNNGFEAVKLIIEAGGGKVIMDKIRVQILKIRDEELRLLDIRVLKPNEAKTNTFIIHISLLFFSLLIIFIVSILTIHSIVNPIKKLQEGVSIVRQGNMEYNFDSFANNEIGNLSLAFDSMLKRLKNTMASKKLLEQEITARKLTEQDLTAAKTSLEISEKELIESNKTKDKFFSIVAHDLKSPFNSMLGFSNLLLEDYEVLTNEKKHYFSKIIHINIENTYSLLENLLLWSRSQLSAIQFYPEEENLHLLIGNVLKTLMLPAELKLIDIKNNIPEETLFSVDRNMLSTIIRNLIGNALKFTDNGGEISVKVKNSKESVHANFIEIIVQDNGVGIAKDAQEKLFNINKNSSTTGTANERGTGLGLVLCKEFVEKHGGKIWVISELGNGSSFHFTLKKM